jgi:CheY-like chemotaxis protein
MANDPDPSPSEPRPAPPPAPGAGPRRQPRRILIVEDEMLVAMLLEDILAGLGHVVAGTAPNVRQALAMLDSAAFDFAILDVNLPDGRSDAVADALMERGVPFLFATGYGVQGVDGRHRAAPVLQKPYDEGSLAAAIDAALAGRG